MMLRPAMGAIWPRKRSAQNDNQNEKQDSVHVAGPSRILLANVMRDAGFPRRSVSDRSQQGARVLALNGQPLRPNGLPSTSSIRHGFAALRTAQSRFCSTLETATRHTSTIR